MPFKHGLYFRISLLIALALSSPLARAQAGNAGAVRGTVTDPTGAVIPGATVHLTNEVSGLDRTATTDATGQFEFTNVPFNPYQVTVTATGFSQLNQNVEIRSVGWNEPEAGSSDRRREFHRDGGSHRRPD